MNRIVKCDWQTRQTCLYLAPQLNGHAALLRRSEAIRRKSSMIAVGSPRRHPLDRAADRLTSSTQMGQPMWLAPSARKIPDDHLARPTVAETTVWERGGFEG